MICSQRNYKVPKFIAVSSKMKETLEICDHYAATNEPVLVTGETGTGKELLCRRLHFKSARRDRPFVPINCGAIPVELFERELFGHARGAYTGATTAGNGYLNQAEGGTLLLDEIGELPLVAQSKLLRFLDDQSYNMVGDPRLRRANVRIVAATNKNLMELGEKGLFRSDLRFRVASLEISIPPLRKRRSDIIPLLLHFLETQIDGSVDVADFLDQHEIECVCRKDWPGNARELLALARILALRSRVPSLEPKIGQILAVKNGKGNAFIKPPYTDLVKMLHKYDGNKARLARSLGVARSTLYRWLQLKASIPDPVFTDKEE